MTRKLIIIFILVIQIVADDNKYKIVSLEEGLIRGEKYWDGDYYEYFGVPYAKVPTGKDRFKGPLKPKRWDGILDASDKTIACPQVYYTGEDPDDIIVTGQEECLTMNLLVPTAASNDNLMPVLVYIHSGAFSVGHGNIARYNYLARHDVVVISFNYRLGAIGFLCLGTEDVPGNAGMKDQVAALKWINKNINKFGGDPSKVTVAGFSVGAAMVELLSLSKETEGLIDKIILESGSALAPWAINREPVDTALNYATSMGYNNTRSLKDLTDWYLKASADTLAMKSLHFFLKNGTFGFAPCIEHVHENSDAFLTESPLIIMRKGKGHRVAVITGFSNMEGLSRINHFDTWSEDMENNFTEFLPTDLQFKDNKLKADAVESIKEYYFNGEGITHDHLQGYVDYWSDTMFKYPIMKSVELYAHYLDRPLFLYEFVYVGQLSAKHNYMDMIAGASHRDQTSYILDFYSWTNDYNDLNTRERLTTMWTDFVKYEDPTAYESLLIDFKWHEYSQENAGYLHINTTLEMRSYLFAESYKFWNKIYEKQDFRAISRK